ncbi:maleylacetoacetate isomerase [Lichenihabitans sp. PAMC28606]|uniref:maleylacetoacetate isomerase n=1 Tax=Lichenihabitans sp. PAMC28606 TaxID=2880932 RepID=UPI001D0B3B88|nr:maleylacetoacetate isomerase [Lichenihabitans sp. PAMC28606]UDL93295.1 maleylacetoacetate isomerase [Lichenihabitans sp. PAMC28606]
MTSEQPLELFSFWRTSAVYRVRVALSLKGLQAKETFIDLDAGQQRSDAFLAINPLAAIPALVVAGQTTLTQSTAILEYLDETTPEPPLLPADALGRARVRSIAAMLVADTHPFVTPRVKRYLTTTGGFDDAAWRAWQIQWFTTGLQAVDKRLSAEPETGRFCHGDRVTLADICLASIPAVMQVFKISVADIPTVDRIVASCNALPAFAEADPYKQVGAPAR